MKYLSPSYILVVISIVISSCSKSDNSGSINNITTLEKEYKALNGDNVNFFFVESSSATRGCAGSNCNSIYKFNFKNLSYATDITLFTQSGIIQIKSIWSRFTTETEFVQTGGNYDASEYKLQYTLKDGRVLITSWIKF